MSSTLSPSQPGDPSASPVLPSAWEQQDAFTGPDFTVLRPARQALWLENNPKRCLNRLADPTVRQALHQPGNAPVRQAYNELLGYALLQQNRYAEAGAHWQATGCWYLAGLAFVLAGQMEAARQAWAQVYTERRNHWCVVLYGLLTRQLQLWPTFLQVRNHLELTITFLIRSGQNQCLQSLLSYIPWLAQVNQEAYKLAGRSLMQEGYMVEARPLLLKAQALFPMDAEIYFHLGQFYVRCHQPTEARLMLHQCLMMNPYYTPAKTLLQTLPPPPDGLKQQGL